MSLCSRESGVCGGTQKKEIDNELELQGSESEWDRKTQRGREKARGGGAEV